MGTKTVYEWLQELPEPYRTEAVENLKVDEAALRANSIPDAMARAFNWQDSPQGFDYWELYYHHLCI